MHRGKRASNYIVELAQRNIATTQISKCNPRCISKASLCPFSATNPLLFPQVDFKAMVYFCQFVVTPCLLVWDLTSFTQLGDSSILLHV